MMNPALERLIAHIQTELVFGQVLIQRAGSAFLLRHAADRDLATPPLRPCPVSELRALAQKTAAGAFRPLKSAPTLVRGWTTRAESPFALEQALNHLYPGALGDWHAAQSSPPPVTSYRTLTERQTGMYRITRLLDDATAEAVARAVCHPRFCLKRRLWTVGTLAAEAPDTKSLIPCLEPCALLLEFARTAMRSTQDPRVSMTLSPAEGETLLAALDLALTQPTPPELREADFDAPANPRRLQWLKEKVSALSSASPAS